MQGLVSKASVEFSNNPSSTGPPPDIVSISSSKYRFDQSGKVKVYHKSISKSVVDAKWHDEIDQQLVEERLHHIFGNKRHRQLTGSYVYLSEARYQNNLFRADPNYYTMKDLGRGWHDLAYVKSHKPAAGDKLASFPVQLLGFIRVESVSTPVHVAAAHMPKQYGLSNTDLQIAEGAEFALVHEMKFDTHPNRPHAQTKLLSIAHKQLTPELNALAISIIRVSDIQGTCLGVPNLGAIEESVGRTHQTVFKIRETLDHAYIIIQPRANWPNLYRAGIEEWHAGWSTPNPRKRSAPGYPS
jgi:hypothetical protein